MYILNIGLDGMPAEAGESIGKRALFAARALRAAGFIVASAQVFVSDTEDTLVVKASAGPCMPSSPRGDAVTNAVFKLSETLGQDCISLYLPIADKGWLIGPKAAAWGDFNPEFFIMPGGDRLARKGEAA